MKQLRILTWHVHGNYLYYLSQTSHTFILPYKQGSSEEGYGARTPGFSWGKNVIAVDADKIKETEFDIILFQSRKNYELDQFAILTEAQRRLPKIYLEHDPPRESPTDTPHFAIDPEVHIVHVTCFNQLMWDNGINPTSVVTHGVPDYGHLYTGKKERGIVVVNGIKKRGRRLGYDIFQRVRKEIPLDIIGMGSKEIGGLGDIPADELPAFISEYRFFFNPIRYTSLGLAVCEAMMAGLPVVGLATTEMPGIIRNGYSGFISCDENDLIGQMKNFLSDSDTATYISRGARATALEKFNMRRFTEDWKKTFDFVIKANTKNTPQNIHEPQQHTSIT